MDSNDGYNEENLDKEREGMKAGMIIIRNILKKQIDKEMIMSRKLINT